MITESRSSWGMYAMGAALAVLAATFMIIAFAGGVDAAAVLSEEASGDGGENWFVPVFVALLVIGIIAAVVAVAVVKSGKHQKPAEEDVVDEPASVGPREEPEESVCEEAPVEEAPVEEESVEEESVEEAPVEEVQVEEPAEEPIEEEPAEEDVVDEPAAEETSEEEPEEEKKN